ncbi:MAG TPA: ABC transporter substrate-binding protein [Roseiflexaceae bacterium]|nr:ABC transporter substrate-binding protein [Roseiflexaceae bacterium]
MTKRISRRAFLRAFGGGAAVASGSALLAACGGQPTTTGGEATATGAGATAATAPTSGAVAPTTVSQTGSTVEVVYWGSFSGALGEAEQAMVKAFNDSQQDVRVNYQFQGTYEETAQKLTAALRARTAPDLSLLSDVWWFRFYLAKALSPLDDLAAGAGVDFADYQPVLIDEGVREGAHYWVPFARSTPLFYYNKDIWAEAGLPDRGPETWQEFQEWAPKLVKKDGDTLTRAAFGHPNSGGYIAWLFQSVTWQFGGAYSTPDFKITLNEPNNIRAAQFYRDSVNTWKWATTPTDIDTDFQGGLIASMMASTGGLAGYEKNATFKVGTAFLPKETNFGCCTGGAGLAVLAGAPAEKQQAAMKYIAFATSTEGTTTWSQSTGYMPVRKSAVQSEKMQTFFTERPNFKVAVDQLPQTKAQDAARVFIPGGDQIIGKGLERITVGNEDPAAVWKDVTVELEGAAEPVLRDLEALKG